MRAPVRFPHGTTQPNLLSWHKHGRLPMYIQNIQTRMSESQNEKCAADYSNDTTLRL